MLIQSILVSIWAFMNGRVFNEYFCWIIRGAPLVTGTITGILMGDWKSGAMIGATIQLLYMGNVTVGGIASYDKCYASIIATAVCSTSFALQLTALVISPLRFNNISSPEAGSIPNERTTQIRERDSPSS